jgi:hypothetical protein
MRTLGASLIAVLLAATPAAQAPNPGADAFAQKLKQALDAHDPQGVASLAQFPLTVMVSGFRIPFENAAAFTKGYDAFFTPAFRCRVANAIAHHEFTNASEGMSIAGSAIYAERRNGDLKITRMLIPGSAPAPGLPAERQVDFAGRPMAQALGRLERDDYDRFVLNARAHQRLDVSITGFTGASFAIRVLDDKAGARVTTNLHVGPRTWSGVVPATATYRVEIQRTAPYCDPPMQYQLTLTLDR